MITALEYDNAYNRLVAEVLEAQIASDKLIGEVRRHRSKHGGASRNVPSREPLDHAQTQITFEAPLSRDVVRQMDIDGHSTFLATLSASQVEEMRAMLLSRVAEVCVATGNSKSADGAPLNPDLILDMLEMIDVRFDDNGAPIMPTLVLHPDQMGKLMGVPLTEHHVRRKIEIMRRKKLLWEKNRRTRRLQGI